MRPKRPSRWAIAAWNVGVDQKLAPVFNHVHRRSTERRARKLLELSAGYDGNRLAPVPSRVAPELLSEVRNHVVPSHDDTSSASAHGDLARFDRFGFGQMELQHALLELRADASRIDTVRHAKQRPKW